MPDTLPTKLHDISDKELLAHYLKVMKELKRRKIIRSFNNPTGDIGESIVSKRLNLTLASKSVKGYDAKDKDGIKYQIKARWKGARGWRNLVGLRDLEDRLFDRMAVAILDENTYEIQWLFYFPYEVADGCAKPTTRGFKRITLTKKFLHDPRIVWIVGSPRESGKATDTQREKLPEGGRLTLHEAIVRVLSERGDNGLTVSEIYRQIVKRGLYEKQDGKPVSLQQVHARIRNYKNLFNFDRTVSPMVIRLRKVDCSGDGENN